MSTIIEQEVRETVLTEADIETILEVYQETGIEEDGGPGLPPIIPFKGPEVAAYFPARNGAPQWGSIPKLGTTRMEAAMAESSRVSGRPTMKTYRHFRRECVNSLRWPKGIPVGYTDISTPKQVGGGEYVYSHAVCDLTARELTRLYAFADERIPLTKRQIEMDAKRKENVRMQRAAPDASALMDLLGKALAGAAVAKSEEAPAAPAKPRGRPRKASAEEGSES